jgi:hypothetical protein
LEIKISWLGFLTGDRPLSRYGSTLLPILLITNMLVKGIDLAEDGSCMLRKAYEEVEFTNDKRVFSVWNWCLLLGWTAVHRNALILFENGLFMIFPAHVSNSLSFRLVLVSNNHQRRSLLCLHFSTFACSLLHRRLVELIDISTPHQAKIIRANILHDNLMDVYDHDDL